MALSSLVDLTSIVTLPGVKERTVTPGHGVSPGVVRDMWRHGAAARSGEACEYYPDKAAGEATSFGAEGCGACDATGGDERHGVSDGGHETAGGVFRDAF